MRSIYDEDWIILDKWEPLTWQDSNEIIIFWIKSEAENECIDWQVVINVWDLERILKRIGEQIENLYL